MQDDEHSTKTEAAYRLLRRDILDDAPEARARP